MAINYGKVVGRFLGSVEDGIDFDDEPDLVPLSGFVTFTPSVSKVLSNDPEPMFIFPQPIRATIDGQGYLSHNLKRGVKLLAPTEDVNPSGWTWKVSFELRRGNTSINTGSFDIEVPPYEPGPNSSNPDIGSTAVNLALVTPVDGTPGNAISKGDSVESISLSADGTSLVFVVGSSQQEVPLPDFDQKVQDAVADQANIQVVAEQAVLSQIASRDLVETTDPRLPVNADSLDMVLVETDESGKVSRYVDNAGRTWIKLHPEADVPGTAKTISAYGTLYSIVDEDGRVAFEVDSTGTVKIPKLSETVVDDISDRVRGGLASGPDIVCWGDSMTAGAGGNGTTYPSVLATLSGRTVHNRGVGGETSVTIAARATAPPMIVTPVGNQIPAAGSVQLTIFPVDGSTPSPLKQGSASNWSDVTIAGVNGSITRDSTTEIYSFNRSQSGEAVSVTVPVAVINNDALARRGDIHIIWIGQNGPSKERAMADANAIIQEMTAHEKRYIVMSKPTSTDSEDAEWRAKYGRRFISPRRHLVDYGLQEAGIAPTSQDLTDISNGTVPTSLRVDGVHFNAAGYTVLANHIYARLREFGWI